MPSATSVLRYGNPTCARDPATESSDWLRKWYGVVAELSKSSPSWESIQPLVAFGRSMSAMVEPNRLWFDSYSQNIRPHPVVAPTCRAAAMMPWNSTHDSPRASIPL